MTENELKGEKSNFILSETKSLWALASGHELTFL